MRVTCSRVACVYDEPSQEDFVFVKLINEVILDDIYTSSHIVFFGHTLPKKNSKENSQ